MKPQIQKMCVEKKKLFELSTGRLVSYSLPTLNLDVILKQFNFHYFSVGGNIFKLKTMTDWLNRSMGSIDLNFVNRFQLFTISSIWSTTAFFWLFQFPMKG